VFKLRTLDREDFGSCDSEEFNHDWQLITVGDIKGTEG
jgi:hypothetical protein